MIIHQTSKYKLHDQELEYKNILMNIHTDCRYKFWNDSDIYNLCKIYYPSILTIWNDLLGIQKADIGRYVILYVHGGLYVDTDIIFQQHINNVIPVKYQIDDNINQILFAPSIKSFPIISSIKLTNYLLWVKYPKHPILKIIIDESINRIKKKYKKKFPNFTKIPHTTGAVMITETLNKHNINLKKIVFDNKLVIDKHSSNTILPKHYVCIHIGNTTNKNKIGWNKDFFSNFVDIENKIKHILKIKGNTYQVPVICILLIICLIYTCNYYILGKRKIKMKYLNILIFLFFFITNNLGFFK